jgi:hypothetical protein
MIERIGAIDEPWRVGNAFPGRWNEAIGAIDEA